MKRFLVLSRRPVDWLLDETMRALHHVRFQVSVTSPSPVLAHVEALGPSVLCVSGSCSA